MTSYKRRVDCFPDDNRPSKRQAPSEATSHKPFQRHKPHPDAGIGRNFHNVPYPLSLLPNKSWLALHNDDGSSAVCAKCGKPTKPTLHQRKMFLVAERLSWEPGSTSSVQRNRNEESLWSVNAELDVLDPVVFDDEDTVGGKQSLEDRWFPFEDQFDAEMTFRLLREADGFSHESFLSWKAMTTQLPRDIFEIPDAQDANGATHQRNLEPWESELEVWFEGSEEEIEMRIAQLLLLSSNYATKWFVLPPSPWPAHEDIMSKLEKISRQVYALESLLSLKRDQPKEQYNGPLPFFSILQTRQDSADNNIKSKLLSDIVSLLNGFSECYAYITQALESKLPGLGHLHRTRFLDRIFDLKIEQIKDVFAIDVRQSNPRRKLQIPRNFFGKEPTNQDDMVRLAKEIRHSKWFPATFGLPYYWASPSRLAFCPIMQLARLPPFGTIADALDLDTPFSDGFAQSLHTLFLSACTWSLHYDYTGFESAEGHWARLKRFTAHCQEVKPDWSFAKWNVLDVFKEDGGLPGLFCAALPWLACRANSYQNLRSLFETEARESCVILTADMTATKFSQLLRHIDLRLSGPDQLVVQNAQPCRKPFAELSPNTVQQGPAKARLPEALPDKAKFLSTSAKAVRAPEIFVDLTVDDDEKATQRSAQHPSMKISALVDSSVTASEHSADTAYHTKLAQIDNYLCRVEAKVRERDKQVNSSGIANGKPSQSTTPESDMPLYCAAWCESIDPLHPRPVSGLAALNHTATFAGDGSKTLADFYSLLDKIERTSPMAAHFLEAYADRLRSEVCKYCWHEENCLEKRDLRDRDILCARPTWTGRGLKAFVCEGGSARQTTDTGTIPLSQPVIQSLRSLPCAERAQEWLSRCYEADDESKLLQSDIFEAFDQAFWIKDINVQDLVNGIQNVWPNARIIHESSNDGMPGIKRMIKGIRLREIPVDVRYVDPVGEDDDRASIVDMTEGDESENATIISEEDDEDDITLSEEVDEEMDTEEEFQENRRRWLEEERQYRVANRRGMFERLAGMNDEEAEQVNWSVYWE